LKLLPIEPKQQSLKFSLEQNQFSQHIKGLLMSGHPINAACYLDGQAYIRLIGSEQGVSFSYQEINDSLSQKTVKLQEIENSFWSELNEQRLAFFDHSQPLWRLSLPAINKHRSESFEQFMVAEDKQLIDWGGALRWFYSNQLAEKIRQYAKSQGGHAQLFRDNGFRGNSMDDDKLKNISKQQPLTPAMLKLHQRLKHAIDPHLIFNQGCIYPDL
jgi:hypothetical protein